MNRRHRVVLRGKVRGRRARAAGVGVLLVVLGAFAALTLRHFGREFAPAFSLAAAKARLAPRIDAVELTGAPEGLRAPMLALLEAAPGGAAEKAQALRAAYPCIQDLRVRRDWFKRAARFEASTRRAIARVERRGRRAGYLGDDGALFAAPDELYPDAKVVVEVEGAAEPELQALARSLASIARSKDLLSTLERMRRVSAEDGWEAAFADGTRAQWGELSWTDEKLARLREVVLDARERFEGGLTADLRYFEDGKVLVRPRKG